MIFKDLIPFFILTVLVFIGFVLALYFIVGGDIGKGVEDAEDDALVVLEMHYNYNYAELKRLHYMSGLLLIFSMLWGICMFGVDLIRTIFVFLYCVNFGLTLLFIKVHAKQTTIIANTY